jgi:hypothetical protein
VNINQEKKTQTLGNNLIGQAKKGNEKTKDLRGTAPFGMEGEMLSIKT